MQTTDTITIPFFSRFGHALFSTGGFIRDMKISTKFHFLSKIEIKATRLVVLFCFGESFLFLFLSKKKWNLGRI